MTIHYDADILGDYLHGELGPEQDAAVHAHLEGCSTCRTVHDDAVRLREWARRAARAEERELPAAVSANVWAAILAQQPSLPERLRSYWRPLLTIPVAAGVVAAAFVFGIPVLAPSTPPVRVAATYYFEAHAAQALSNPLADRSAITTMTLDRSTLPVIDATDVDAPDDSGAQSP